LENLFIYSIPFQDLTFLTSFPKLRDFGVLYSEKVVSLTGLEQLTNLESLKLLPGVSHARTQCGLSYGFRN